MDDTLLDPPDLTPTGHRRQEVILRTVLAATAGRRRRRAARRAVVTAGVVALAGVGVWSLMRGGGPVTDPQPITGRAVVPTAPHADTGARPAGRNPEPASDLPRVVEGAPTPAGTPAGVATTAAEATPAGSAAQAGGEPIVITRIATDPTLVARWAVRGPTLAVERLDDEGLQRALGSAGLTGGVVVRRGRPELWWLPVAVRTSAATDGRSFRAF